MFRDKKLRAGKLLRTADKLAGWAGGRKGAGKASGAKRNRGPGCDLQTATKLLGTLSGFAFEREIGICAEK